MPIESLGQLLDPWGCRVTCLAPFEVRTFIHRPAMVERARRPSKPSAERRQPPTGFKKSRQPRNVNAHPFPTGTKSRSAIRRRLVLRPFACTASNGEPHPREIILGATTSRARDQLPKVEPTDRQTSSATRRTLSHLPKLTQQDVQPAATEPVGERVSAVRLRPSVPLSDGPPRELARFQQRATLVSLGFARAVLPRPQKPRDFAEPPT